jgi:hypothetical protein
MLSLYNIEAKQTTVKNPTSNSLVKLTIQLLRISCIQRLLATITLVKLITFFRLLFFAIRAATPSNCAYFPSQLAYGVDMLFCQQIHIDWLELKPKRQKQSMANNEKKNKKQLEHTYKVNDLVLILKKSDEMDKTAKISSPTYNKDPYRILDIFNNGTVKILQGAWTDIINIRGLIPYYKKEDN